MRTLFYDDVLENKAISGSVFLAGPTVRGLGRTPWRAQALELMQSAGFAGTVLLPEFSSGLFQRLAPLRFGQPPSPVPGMRAVSHNVLHWETTGIENASVVLFWMPFSIAHEDDPASLPGFTTRAEVSREIARDHSRIVLGMPQGALSGGHIRYHAHQAGLRIHETLEQTVAEALQRIHSNPILLNLSEDSIAARTTFEDVMISDSPQDPR